MFKNETSSQDLNCTSTLKTDYNVYTKGKSLTIFNKEQNSHQLD